jgi:hypothetical protein
MRQISVVRSFVDPRSYAGRNGAGIALDQSDITPETLLHLQDYGINIGRNALRQMVEAFGMDAMDSAPLSPLSSPSLMVPVQFLQSWLPGFVRYITGKRAIDEFIGISTMGDWSDEEIVQGIIEQLGEAEEYSDYTNVPVSSFNNNFETRTIVRLEKGILVGTLESDRAAKIRIDVATEKRGAASLALEIARNKIGFYGYNNGTNRTFGFLNDPNALAYQTVATGTGGYLWTQKTVLEIIADLRTAFQQLRTQSQDVIDPQTANIVLAVPTDKKEYLTVTSDLGYSVMEWLEKNYKNVRIVSAPQLNAANGGSDVFYVWAEQVEDGGTDDGRTWLQCVPAKFQTLGVEKRSKSYIEDYTNATAGAFLKRAYAMVRYSGI